MSDLTREEASELVDSIRQDNGGSTEEEKRGAQPAFIRAYEKTRKRVITLTENVAVKIYTRSTRFVYELIQNAEDNKYNVANDSDKQPYLRFNVTRRKITIDSNEDGFSEEDVKAICDIGESKKQGNRGYIGEKGLGFKSVFKIASNVRVQSGPFAFFFNYDAGASGDGLGLFTPFNCDHEDLDQDVRTRITLTLKDQLDYDSLVEEFTEIPDTILLFLTKVKHFQTTVRIGNTVHEREYEYLGQKDSDRGRIVIYENGDRSSWRDLEYIFRRKRIHELPAEESREDISDAEVVLAFPVDAGDNPVIEAQHVCAYLPLRKIGLPFQVQSDFVTQTSREDLSNCPWNRALREGISEVFVDAVVDFCQSSTLQYTWPRYVPIKSIVDPFWAQLRSLISSRLEDLPVLRTYESGTLKCIGQLRYLPITWYDQGRPLFKDLSDEIYLSSNYSEEEQDTLLGIGLRIINFDQLWERFKADLRSKSSRMKNAQTSESWHSLCASKILAWANRGSQLLEKIQSLKIIPLRDGSWTSVSSGPVFYNDIDGIEIPTDLGLRIVDPKAAAHAARKKLFDAIGVRYCEFGQVKKLIVGKYAKWNNVDLSSSVSHLRFLFHHCPESEQPIDKTMFVFDADETPVYRIRVALGRPEMVVDDIYFDVPGAYNAKAICAEISDSEGFNIHLVHPAYLAYEEANSSLHDLSWKDWLKKHGGVMQVPRLTDARNTLKLSPFFTWIIKNRSELLLGILKTHWKTYAGQINSAAGSSQSEVLTTLKNVEIRCSNKEQVALNNTFLPTDKLSELADQLDLRNKIRFLQLSNDLPEASLKDWNFLNKFGVILEDSLDFYLEALRSISSKTSQPTDRKSLIEIYEAIEKGAGYDDHRRIREFFKTRNVVHGKFSVDGDYSWVEFADCLYEGPDFLDMYCVLSKHDDFWKSPNCRNLFTHILKIPTADWWQFVEQMIGEKSKSGRRSSADTRARVSMIYHALNLDRSEDIDWKHICDNFEDKQLVYIPERGWQSPSKCVWSDHNYVADIFPISDSYHDLETFFVDKLHVPSPTLQSQLTELQNLSNNEQPIPDKFANVRALIKEINLWTPQKEDVSILLDKKVIPIIDTNGQQQLVQPNETFAIVDSDKYKDIFSGKVPIFAIPFEEIMTVREFFGALNLTSRYMSRLVSETTEAKDSFADGELSKELRRRAYALVRCAIFFGKPDIWNSGLELYKLLKQVTIYQTDEVVSSITLKIGRRVLATQSSKGMIHIESDGSNLRLYVPKNERMRKRSYLTGVPDRLMAQLSVIGGDGAKAISDVLKSDFEDLDDLLKELSIPEVLHLKQHVDGDLIEGYVYTDDEWSNQGLSDADARPVSSSLTPTNSSMFIFRGSSSATPVQTTSRATTPDARSSLSPFGGQHFSPASSSRERETIVTRLDAYVRHYKILLHKVINAGEHDDLPSNFDFATYRSNVSNPVSVDSDEIFGIRSQDTMAHDMRIGAAGELYAFEVLQHHLDSFGIDNWRSTIRHYVAIHQKYSHISAWTGRETADIVYEDHASALTGLMIRYGYLPNYTIWRDKTPTYYIEVKTTTGPCDTRFFMSKAQVRRMREMRLDPNRPSPNIYMICRVYNLTGNKIDMRILLDPATLETEGTLLVEAEQYTVAQPRT